MPHSPWRHTASNSGATPRARARWAALERLTAEGRIEPDMSVFRQMQKQPEFHEQIWQYVNRRC
jgi:hypothetical protein